MKELRRFIAWQPVLTDHQAFTYQQLSHQAEAPMVAYVSRLEDTIRRAQGWTDTKVTSIERKIIPSRGFLRYCYRQIYKQRNDIHLFASAFSEWRLTVCLLIALRLGVECYLISEPYSQSPLGYYSDRLNLADYFKSLLRPYLYKAYGFALRKRIVGVFAISPRAVEQFRKAGFPSDRLFPFGYFIPSVATRQSHFDTSEQRMNKNLQVVYVGSLIPRKGLDILIDAVRRANISGSEVQLDIYGPGKIDFFDIDGLNICYRGQIPFGRAQEWIAKYDLLVLPSRYDGWGVVVNEALCAGVPVLCSDQVGARILVETFSTGAVFVSEDSEALSSRLSELAVDRKRLLKMRFSCQAAASAIQPCAAASYMLDVIRAPRIAKALVPSPWY